MKGRIDINRFVALSSTNHAKLYGLYPRKGTISVGADADIALWDPNKVVTLTNSLLQHGADYTPFEGLEVRGWPVQLFLRGKSVVESCTFTSAEPAGQYIHRGRSSLLSQTAQGVA